MKTNITFKCLASVIASLTAQKSEQNNSFTSQDFVIWDLEHLALDSKPVRYTLVSFCI